MVNASSPTSIMLIPLITDVVNGIGTPKSASLALTIGLSTPTRSVCQFLINALLMMNQVLALPATRDMILRMENASSPTPTMLSHQTSDVELGIGTNKSASLAPTNGFSMPTKFVCQFLTSAPLMMLQELVLPASRDMTSRKENASSPTQTMPSPLILDAVSGIGTTKFA